MHSATRRTSVLVAIVTAALAILPAKAVTVLVSYELVQGIAAIDPVTVPNPQGGEDITITPSLTIDEGSFDALFENGTPLGAVGNGPAAIRNLAFSGSISVAISTVINLGVISPTVTADLIGPITGTQVSDATGSIIGDATVFSNANPGNFNVAAGPLECSDSVFGLFCVLLEDTLGQSFPIELIALDDAPLPFTGVFDGLDTPGSSTAGNSFDFSIPLIDTTSFGVNVGFEWTETGRLVVPEPTASVLALIGFTILSRRRRRA